MKGAFWHDLFRQRRNNLLQAAAGHRLRFKKPEQSRKRKQRKPQSFGRGNRADNRSAQQGRAHGQPFGPAERRVQPELHFSLESGDFGEREKARVSRRDKRSRAQFRASS